jgi:rod shape-determining protein MreD
MTVLGFAVGQLEERFLTLNMPMKVGVLGLGFFVCDMIYYGITGLSGEVVTNLVLTKTLPECIYTMLVGGVFFYLDLGKKKKKHA